jgi:ketosteroid isomerase-like protein
VTARDTIDEYFRLVNSDGWDELTGLFDPEATYRTPGARLRVGRADVIGLYRRMFAAWSVHHDTATRVLVDGDAAAVEVRFDGTTLDGRTVTFDAVDIFHFRDDRIATLATWYDLIAVRAQLEPAASTG